ncbi:DNA alkylation repair protein [Flavitalea sp.]|nr:DNA alkylation repair protein [Flavitalea sp.]
MKPNSKVNAAKTSALKKTIKAKHKAEEFVEQLTFLASQKASKNSKFFSDDNPDNKFLGVRMADIFLLAKHHMQMPIEEIQKLLNNDFYEVRVGAVSIMDFEARNKKISEEQKKALYQLYIKHHDRINNWDMVDRSAPFVVGGYLFDKSRAPLYKLAKSKNVWERRTAIVSTYFFIRQNDLDDTFKIAEILVHDKHDLINKAVGSWVREAGKRDEARLLGFLDKYGKTMPRVTLRYAIEKLDNKVKKMYMTVI